MRIRDRLHRVHELQREGDGRWLRAAMAHEVQRTAARVRDIPAAQLAPYFIVTFCTLKFPISPTYSVLSLRQSIALTVPNSLSSLPALPNLPIIVPSRRILLISPAVSMSVGGFEFDNYST